MFGLNEKKQFTFEIENYHDFSEKIVNSTDAKRCTIKKLTNSLYMVYVDFLDSSQWKNSISENSIFMVFEIEAPGLLKYYRGGAIPLTPADKENPKYKYYALKGVEDPLFDAGGKRMRKSKVKSVDEVITKITDYCNKVTEAIKIDQNVDKIEDINK